MWSRNGESFDYFHLQSFLGFCNESCRLFVKSVSDGLVCACVCVCLLGCVLLQFLESVIWH